MANHPPIMITLEVRPDLARRLEHTDHASPEAMELARWAAQSGAAFEPIFPGVDDPRMASFYTVQVPRQSQADRLLLRLRAHPAVVGAYIKPHDELP